MNSLLLLGGFASAQVARVAVCNIVVRHVPPERLAEVFHELGCWFTFTKWWRR